MGGGFSPLRPPLDPTLGSGLRTKVSKLPRNWSDFLKDETELYNFLTEIMSAADIPEDKAVFITSDSNVIC